MFLRKYRILIVVAFMGIFASKMVISGAPVFFAHLDKIFMSAVIMQLENENSGDDTTKGNVKFADHKLMFEKIDVLYVPLIINGSVKNEFIEHFRRHVDPYHPSVPTPPPNFA